MQAQRRNSLTELGEDFFTYAANFLSLAGGTSASSNITIEASSDFRWIKGEYFCDIAAAIQTDDTRVIPLVSILIIDSGPGRQLSNIAIPLTSIFGTGERPFILPVSRIFEARSSIQLQVVNLTAATTYNLRVCLTGAKIFKPGK